MSQQTAPVELITQPETYSFALSGSLAGNIDNEELDTDTRNGRASGRLFLDANISKRLLASIHINALQTRNYALDTANIANLAFSHNNYKFYLGLVYQGKQSTEGSHSWFGNYSISSVHLADSITGAGSNLAFTMYRINLGIKLMWQADWDQDLLVHGAIKLNRLWLEDPAGKSKALEKAFGLAPEESLMRIYNGFGLKTTIQLNNISIFFETQLNYNSEGTPGQISIPGFMDHTFYSVGFTSNSTAILGKRKSVDAEEKKPPEESPSADNNQ